MSIQPLEDNFCLTKLCVSSWKVEIADAERTKRNWTLGKALRTGHFGFIALAFFLTASAYQGTLLHSVYAMADAILKRVTGAYVSTFSVCCISLISTCVFIWLAGPGKVKRMVRR